MLSSLGFTSPPNKMAKKDGSEDSIGVFVIISIIIIVITIIIIIIGVFVINSNSA